MNDATPQRCPALKDGFTWYEKLLVRGGSAGFVAIGAVGIYLDNPTVAAGYLLFAAVAGLLVIYDFFCVYCPYPYTYSDCLFFPHQLLSAVVKRRRGKIHWVRKALLVLTAAGLVLIPQYWLLHRWELLAGFWVVAVPLGLAFPLYFCGRCRHGQCPMSGVSSHESAQTTEGPE